MPKLTDTQTIVLSRAATRPGNLAMPLPEGLHGAAAQKAVTAMITRGWLEEVEANLRRGEPMWRETGDGHTQAKTSEIYTKGVNRTKLAAEAMQMMNGMEW